MASPTLVLVTTTVRSLGRWNEVRQMLKLGGATARQVESVDCVEADLTADKGWREACSGCVYVLHVASPFPAAVPKDRNDLIIPARDGTLRGLKAAKNAGTVKRVVLTSSFAAIGYGHDPKRQEVFTEKDWTNLKNPASPVSSYGQNKTIAESAAWDYIAEKGHGMKLSVVNPGGIFGPILSTSYPTSHELIVRLLNGQPPFLPHLQFPTVDVRDVADLHLLAMTHSEAAGERFLAISDAGMMWTKDIALVLKANLGDMATKVPTIVIPNIVIRITGLFDKAVAYIVPELGKSKKGTNEKAKTVLGWKPRSIEATMVDTANSLKDFGHVK